MFFFFSWEARNGRIILTQEPEIIIVTYIYVPWAPQHICCDTYTLHGIQRVKNEHLQELMLGKIILSPNKKIITNTIRQNEIIDEELLRKANKFFTPNEFNHALEDLVNRKHALYMHINIIILPPSGII